MPPKDLPIHSQRFAQITARNGIPIREDSLWANHNGDEKPRLRKRAEKALDNLQEPLKKILEADEVVLYVMPAQAPTSVVQQLTLGWMTYYVTKTMLVVTNRRLLVFHVKQKSFGRWEWGRRARSIRFGDLADAKVKGLLSRYIQLQYADGRKEKYWGLRRADAKKLERILEAAMPMRAAEATPARGPVSLCPSCFAGLEAKQESCRQCGQLFATTSEMWKRSVLFPGGGYFYVGQTGLGILDAFAESVLIGVIAFWLLIAAGFPEPVADLEPYATPALAAIVAAFFGALLVLEKLITGLHARHFVKDFYPLSKVPNRLKWLAFGLAAYGAIGAVLWLAIPAEPPPLVQVAPDLSVYRAEFGLFEVNARGEDTFTRATVVPLRPGYRYGVVVRFRTPRPTVQFRSEFEIGGVLMNVQDDEGNPLQQEETLESEGGLIARFWQVLPDEPQDPQTLKIYLDNVLIRSFTFTVQ